MPFQGNRQYLQSRVSESLGLLYATHYPFRQYETGRGVRKSAIHDRLAAIGACHGEAFGSDPTGMPWLVWSPNTNIATAGKLV